jgi:hypothetical protein
MFKLFYFKTFFILFKAFYLKLVLQANTMIQFKTKPVPILTKTTWLY